MNELVLVLVLLAGIAASAYTFKEENKPISSERVLQEAARIGLNASTQEIAAKKEIGTWSDKSIKQELENGAPEPLLLERNSAKGPLAKAKIIARAELFKGVEKHWDRIQASSLNEFAVDSFAKFKPYLKRELDRIQYTESNDKSGYLFMLPWADIRVDTKLKKVSWVIRIGSHLDGNRLEEGAEKIVIPERVSE